MKKINQTSIVILFFLSLVTLIQGCKTSETTHSLAVPEQNLCAEEQDKILVFTKTSGFRHTSIESGVAAFKKLGCQYGLAVDTTENSDTFTTESLKQYATVVFLNTTQNVLNEQQKVSFEKYIRADGGFLGVHAATDTEYDWPWYNKLVGAYFNGHPKIQNANLSIINDQHVSTNMLPKTWSKTDEWYNFKDINTNINVLITIDEESYKGGTNGEHHPISWYHNFDGGRAFYTAMGHTEESYQDKQFLNHLLGALSYTTNIPLTTHHTMPEETRFVRDVLDSNLNEPMELEELPNTGILFIERRGLLKLYDFQLGKTEIIDQLNVHYSNEDGLLGLAVDPNYVENHWIYLFYSAPGEEPIQRVSRFNLVNKELDLASEKVLLTIPVLRECCHSGGGLEFGPDGHLFIGVGDNTHPFGDSDGYGPMDEREGRALWDAQKSASNTNDFRGKILRIKPENDGSYSIPSDNLFPVGTPKTKPEIYVMGVRNPFRFDIDSATGYLHWGDVGPDAGKAKADRGPKGLGEFNLAKYASNWGWPYTRGNNEAYNDYDYATKKSGEKFDPNNLVNQSPNNTGINKLPPAQRSMIWYGYDASEEFTWLGEGGVNPMSGPIYHQPNADNTTHAFPAYFENKHFVYEWMRNWIFVVTLDDNQQYVRAEQFMPSSKFSRPMDMIFAQDGSLYFLEYGQKWNKRNKDARLNRISYVNGNRKPIAKIQANKMSGAAPLDVTLSGANSIDYDNDNLNYQWTINGKFVSDNEVLNHYTFDTNGEYIVELTVTDAADAKDSASLLIVVGNNKPEINISITPDEKVYSDNGQLSYEIIVNDTQDGSSQDGSISADDIKVSFEYISAKMLEESVYLGHKINEKPEGQKLIDGTDCRACHGVSNKINGPSYQAIATKYNKEDVNYLVNKVINGGSGVWGETSMSAHPQLKIEDVTTIVNYILSLDPNSAENKGLPLKGTLHFNKHLGQAKSGQYILKATYQDKGLSKGSSHIDSLRLTQREQIVFKAKEKLKPNSK